MGFRPRGEIFVALRPGITFPAVEMERIASDTGRGQEVLARILRLQDRGYPRTPLNRIGSRTTNLPLLQHRNRREKSGLPREMTSLDTRCRARTVGLTNQALHSKPRACPWQGAAQPLARGWCAQTSTVSPGSGSKHRPPPAAPLHPRRPIARAAGRSCSDNEKGINEFEAEKLRGRIGLARHAPS